MKLLKNIFQRAWLCIWLISLTGCSNKYVIDWWEVIYHYRDVSTYTTKILKVEWADSHSFKQLQWGVWWKDINRVFYKGDIVSGADSSSFEALSDIYWKDQFFGFYKWVTISWSDGLSFKLTTNENFTVDKNDVYSQWVSKWLDPNTFENIDWWRYGDAATVMHQWLVVPVEDISSFKVLNNIFAKDGNNIYAWDKIISDVDYDTFIAKWSMLGKDKYWCHDWYQRINCSN